MKLTTQKKGSAPVFETGGVPRVNLLPRDISAKREQNALLKGWGLRLIAAAGVLVIAAAGMFAWQGLANLRLVTAQAEGDNLIAQIAAKSDIQRLVNTEQSLSGYEATAMATDLVWKDSIDKILQEFPKGSWLCGYDLRSGAAPAGDPTAQTGLSGTITICGSSPSAIPYLAAATSVDGVTSAEVVEGRYDTEISDYAHTISITFDQTIYLDAAEEETE